MSGEFQNQSKSLARLVGCLSEEELVELAGVKKSTAKSWRNRGLGPRHILFGTNYLYPLAGIEEFLQSRSRSCPEIRPLSLVA